MLSGRFLFGQGNRHRDLRHVGRRVVADDVVDEGDFALPRYAANLSKMTADKIDPHGEAMPMGNNVSE